MSRVLGLDVGDVRIGVAISDPLGLTAQGLETLLRRTRTQDIARLTEIARQREVVAVVIGLPVSLDGSEGPQAAKVREFAQALSKALDIPQVFIDERMSTRIATQTLLAADTSRRKRKQVVDMLAAQIILQTYLDRKRI